MPNSQPGPPSSDVERLLDRHAALLRAAETILAEADLIEAELTRRLPPEDPALLKLMKLQKGERV